MIEGKLGHHFQVAEMRHIASPACPAFTACRSAESHCCSCSARPTCPASAADKSALGWSCFQPGLWAQPARFTQRMKDLEKSLCLSDSTYLSWFQRHRQGERASCRPSAREVPLLQPAVTSASILSKGAIGVAACDPGLAFGGKYSECCTRVQILRSTAGGPRCWQAAVASLFKEHNINT